MGVLGGREGVNLKSQEKFAPSRMKSKEIAMNVEMVTGVVDDVDGNEDGKFES